MELLLLLGGVTSFLMVAAIIAIIVIIVYEHRRVNRQTEPGLPAVANCCSVCGTPQKDVRLRQCYWCGELFCDFPDWKSPKERWKERLVSIGVVLLIVGTAVSILGGFIAIALLAVPALMFLELLPDPSRQPIYWNRCGGEVYGPLDATHRTEFVGRRCDRCGGASPGVYPPVPSYEIDEHPQSWDNDSYWYDDDDDDTSGSSIWDGWLIKYDS